MDINMQFFVPFGVFIAALFTILGPAGTYLGGSYQYQTPADLGCTLPSGSAATYVLDDGSEFEEAADQETRDSSDIEFTSSGARLAAGSSSGTYKMRALGDLLTSSGTVTRVNVTVQKDVNDTMTLRWLEAGVFIAETWELSDGANNISVDRTYSTSFLTGGESMSVVMLRDSAQTIQIDRIEIYSEDQRIGSQQLADCYLGSAISYFVAVTSVDVQGQASIVQDIVGNILAIMAMAAVLMAITIVVYAIRSLPLT